MIDSRSLAGSLFGGWSAVSLSTGLTPLERKTMEIIRVAGRSRPEGVAGAIAGIIRGGEQVQAHAIGARAVHRAIKAVILARSYLSTDGIDVICLPGFIEVDIDGLERTAVTITVEPRSGSDTHDHESPHAPNPDQSLQRTGDHGQGNSESLE